MLKDGPDLTKKAPRGARVRLGGFAILPRLIDKARATFAGNPGEYSFDCPLDQQFLNFVGISADAIAQEIKKGLNDGEILDWVQANSGTPRQPFEIEQWSIFMDRRGPDSLEAKAYFAQLLQSLAPHRKDIVSWTDLLDLDDDASFGGRP